MTSKYKLVRECKSTLECNILLHQVNLEFSCEACGKQIRVFVSWEESEKFETETRCCQTLKINARRVSNNKDDADDKTVATISVSGKFKIEKKELCGKDVDWSAVFDDGSIVPLTADDKGSWNVDSVMKQLKGKEESGVNLKRKHAEVEPARDESDWMDDDDDDDADRYDYGESLDDYDTAKTAMWRMRRKRARKQLLV